jgi:hypothetical protein
LGAIYLYRTQTQTTAPRDQGLEIKMTNAFEIGFKHGSTGTTNNYKPANRKNETKTQYDSGFQAGMADQHEKTLPARRELAKLNLSKALRK